MSGVIHSYIVPISSEGERPLLIQAEPLLQRQSSGDAELPVGKGSITDGHELTCSDSATYLARGLASDSGRTRREAEREIAPPPTGLLYTGAKATD